MGGGFAFDDSAWPVLRMRYSTKPSDAEFEACLGALSRHLTKRENFVLTVLADPSASSVDARQLRAAAAWIRTHADELRLYCVGWGLVLPTPLLRGAFRAMLALQPFPAPHLICQSEEELLAWAQTQLGRPAAPPW